MSAVLSKISPPRAERSERTSSPGPPHARVQRQKFDRTVVHGLLNCVRSRTYDQRPEFHAESVDVWIGVREGHERLQERGRGEGGTRREVHRPKVKSESDLKYTQSRPPFSLVCRAAALIHRACTKLHKYIPAFHTHTLVPRSHASTKERTVSPFSRRSAPMMARAASPVLLEPPWAVPPSFEVDIARLGAAGHEIRAGV